MAIKLPLQKQDDEEKPTHIKITVDYSRGGTSYYDGRNYAGGVWAYVQPVTIRDGIVSCVLGRGTKVLLEPLSRKSQKKIAQWTEIIEAEVAAHAGKVYAAILAVCNIEGVAILEDVA